MKKNEHKTRAADYAIQGFLYQFNKTALAILKALDDDTITIEGVVEDIEIESLASLTAIQCKYHEASKYFTHSMIYEPLLQMFKHFSCHQTANISYIIFAHFSNLAIPWPTVDKSTVQAALKSKNEKLKKYIESIPPDSEEKIDIFLEKFKLEFGPSFDEIVKQVGEQLEENGILSGEVETIAYPNTIHKIATLSIKHNPAERRITKKQFLSDLKKIRSTAISRWTLALKTRKQLLEARRKQLKVNLNKNARLRCFIVDPASIEDCETELIIFISEYIDKYHHKLAHLETPILCLCAEQIFLEDIQRRLFAKDIIAEGGYIGGEFQESHFFRDPLFSCKKTRDKIHREFYLRILNWNAHGELLNKKKCDDIFIIGEQNCDSLDLMDINVERLAGVTIKELKYILGVSDVYE